MATKTKKVLERELAKLESINDQLMTEISYVDHLMKMIGFAGGLVSLKETANELYTINSEINDESVDESYDDEGEEQVG
jgi:hypothetical protein